MRLKSRKKIASINNISTINHSFGFTKIKEKDMLGEIEICQNDEKTRIC